MVKHATHHEVKVNLPHHKLKKLANGHRVQVEHHEIGHGPHHLTLHHETHKKLLHARTNKKGMRLGPLTHEEIMASGSLWDTLKSGAKWLGSQALNGIQAGATAAVPELAPVFSGIRSGVKSLTGLGLKHKHVASHKGSTAMKERMAAVRAAKGKSKKHESGSFLLY